MTLPPGVSQRQFAAALTALQSAVGAQWVFSRPEDVDLYRDAYTPFYGEPGEYVPSGAVAPASVEEVQQVVRIANRYHIPLWPISTGRNLGYGGAAPRLSGTMVLDLKRMNRVLEVNEPLAYTLVEPGVSYFDFYRHLREHGHKLWMDCPDPGWGSLIGNALDHGLGHTVMRDHFDSHCGMEIVLPSGELMRTGMGAMPDNRCWQTYKYGFGPHLSPIFGQSNFGIVTKMGFWLLPEQEEARSHVITVAHDADLEPFLENMAYMVNSGIVDSSWQIAAAAPGAGAWTTRIRFYGPPEINAARWRYVKQRLSGIDGATFADGKVYRFPMDTSQIQDEPDDIFAKGGLGIPSLAIFSFSGASRSQGHIFFSPIIPATGAEFRRARQVFTRAYADMGLPPPQIGGWSWFKRSLILLFSMRISHEPGENQRMREQFRTLVRVGAENGWSEYRTAPAFMDDVMGAMSYNDHALLRFNESIKDAIDPNGILAPGKSGIWPRRLRKPA